MQLNWVKANLLSIVFVIRSLNAVPNAIVVEISFLLPKKGEKNIVWSKRKKCLYLLTLACDNNSNYVHLQKSKNLIVSSLE